MQFTFQLPKSAMEESSPQELRGGIKEYASDGSIFDYIIIDPSGGKGHDFNPEESLNIYSELNDLEFTAVFAGGFNGDNVRERISRLRAEKGDSDFCIDAQGRVMNKNKKIKYEPG